MNKKKFRYFIMVTDPDYFDLKARAKRKLQIVDVLSYKEVKMSCRSFVFSSFFKCFGVVKGASSKVALRRLNVASKPPLGGPEAAPEPRK